MKRVYITVFTLLALWLACYIYWRTAERIESAEARVQAIGDYFAQQSIAGTTPTLGGSRSAPDIVRVGDALAVTLSEMRTEFKSGYTVEIQHGDAFGEGGEVTHSIILCTPHDAICLRMRYDSSLDRFHIVGFAKNFISKEKERANQQDQD